PPAPTETDAARPPPDRSHPSNDPEPKPFLINNAPTTISGRDYVGHALDQMQSRGIMPSAVEDAIRHGQFMVGKRSGTSAYYSSANDLTIITDTESGRVITAVWGFVKQ
ncbi:DUF4258 domain-containing protein, partial [Streptomyces goshikiensis]|uniref:DUF4258 domain-containing protein n=1 Tax=Streptomyces goshikiensis TaxID=1942 RepID=UPI0036865B12